VTVVSPWREIRELAGYGTGTDAAAALIHAAADAADSLVSAATAWAVTRAPDDVLVLPCPDGWTREEFRVTITCALAKPKTTAAKGKTTPAATV
jgi:hypothetical protein